MSLTVLALIMFAALLHATWNALIKLGGDRLIIMALLSGSSGVIGLCLTPFFPLPAPAAWPFIAATSFIHIGYIWFLTKAYDHGDFGVVYPIARGVAPLLTATGAMIFGGEFLNGTSLAGVAIIAAGIMSLAHDGSIRTGEGETRSLKPALYALATGCFIASYTLVDGFGVRVSGTVGGYTAWLFALHGLPLVIMVMFIRRDGLVLASRQNWKRGAVGGAFSIAAYWIVIWAFTLGAIAPVAALRETSVVFAAIFAAVHLREGFGVRRGLSALRVGSGIILLAF